MHFLQPSPANTGRSPSQLHPFNMRVNILAISVVANGSYWAFQKLGNYYGVGNLLMVIYTVCNAIGQFFTLVVPIDAPLRMLLGDENVSPHTKRRGPTSWGRASLRLPCNGRPPHERRTPVFDSIGASARGAHILPLKYGDTTRYP